MLKVFDLTVPIALYYYHHISPRNNQLFISHAVTVHLTILKLLDAIKLHRDL